MQANGRMGGQTDKPATRIVDWNTEKWSLEKGFMLKTQKEKNKWYYDWCYQKTEAPEILFRSRENKKKARLMILFKVYFSIFLLGIFKKIFRVEFWAVSMLFSCFFFSSVLAVPQFLCSVERFYWSCLFSKIALVLVPSIFFLILHLFPVHVFIFVSFLICQGCSFFFLFATFWREQWRIWFPCCLFRFELSFIPVSF